MSSIPAIYWMLDVRCSMLDMLCRKDSQKANLIDRSAGCQPAVSPTASRQGVRIPNPIRFLQSMLDVLCRNLCFSPNRGAVSDISRGQRPRVSSQKTDSVAERRGKSHLFKPRWLSWQCCLKSTFAVRCATCSVESFRSVGHHGSLSSLSPRLRRERGWAITQRASSTHVFYRACWTLSILYRNHLGHKTNAGKSRRHSPIPNNFQHDVRPNQGLKARNIIARAEGPGMPRGLSVSPVRAAQIIPYRLTTML
jgi:hypothetical protein